MQAVAYNPGQLNCYCCFMKKFIFSAIIFLVLLLLTWIGALYFVLLKTDIATVPVNKTTYELSQGEYEYKPLTALVSYGAGRPVFLSNQFTLAESAINKGIEHIYLYGRHNIDEEFYNKHKKTLEQPRGAGYWLWKPYFIWKTMEQLPEDSVIIYADSGIVFSKPPAETLIPFLDKEYDIIFSSHGHIPSLGIFMKKEAQIILGIDKNEKILNSPEIWADFMIIKNNASSKKFIKKWLKLCENPDLLTDSPFDPDLQDKNLRLHLHDQALLTFLVATNPQRKMVIKNLRERSGFGIHNFHRHPEDKYTSPKFHIAGIKKKIANLLYNNSILQKIREMQDTIQ
ncbi:MAG: hypothetical protein COA94_01785 [Rickettsiales bacterium]|nr:MAG: hypothetical protein COA94_01785 [Rickettsiales bacterium]